MKKIDNQKKILIMLCFFAISIGLWGNFRQLWLAENLLSASEIAKTMSYGSMLAALYLIYYTNVVSLNKIKIGVFITLTIKIIVTTMLAMVNGIGDIHLIKFLFFVDIACENIVLSSIFPFLISYQKKGELYGKKGVIEYSFKTVGILLGSVLFGKTILKYVINYNACLMISIVFLLFALIVLFFINEDEKKKLELSNKGIIKYVIDHTFLKSFLTYNLFTQIVYYIIFGLNMLILTEFAGLNASSATRFILIFSILASVFGKLALEKLRSKNDYLNFSIKFLMRTILFMLVFITNNRRVLLIGIAYFLLTSAAYDYVINGFIYDHVKEQYTMGVTVIQYVISLVGEAIGVFLAGVMYQYGFRYIYLLAALFMVVQLSIGYSIIYKKRKLQGSLSE